METKTQHLVIMVLSLIVVILAIVLVAKKPNTAEFFSMSAISTMTPAQVQAAASQPQCAAATANYCQLTKNGSQSVNPGQLVAALSNVNAACGGQFPVNQVCAQANPNFQLNPDNLVLGGCCNSRDGPI